MKNKGSEVRLPQLNLVNMARGTERKKCREVLKSFKKQSMYIYISRKFVSRSLQSIFKSLLPASLLQSLTLQHLMLE